MVMKPIHQLVIMLAVLMMCIGMQVGGDEGRRMLVEAVEHIQVRAVAVHCRTVAVQCRGGMGWGRKRGGGFINLILHPSTAHAG